MSENETTEVVPQPEQNRYALVVDGREVGFTEYLDRGDHRVFVHTEVDPAEEGHGYGSTLISGALEQVRAASLRAAATCPFVVRYLEKHREFDDIVDPVSIELRASL
ncbi:GNAT family N-acetyltransferase [Herbiconiux liangxiaofengii]|uniref:GNAT family N-acetyltransferase n=1 Tax=Herbiconiux liangxiaofengii TaxID=3342795 RepID=UPI0035B92D2F